MGEGRERALGPKNFILAAARGLIVEGSHQPEHPQQLQDPDKPASVHAKHECAHGHVGKEGGTKN